MEIVEAPCACGCGELFAPVDAKGRPRRFIRGHNGRGRPNPSTEKLVKPLTWERLVEAGERDAERGCLLWPRPENTGYGSIIHRGRHYSVHRLAYQFAHPDEDIAGLHICHRCDVLWADLTYRRCFEPAHLFAGTSGENTRDAKAKGRLPSGYARVRPERLLRGEQAPRAKLTEEAVRQIRARFTGKRGELAALGREFGVDRETIRCVLIRKSWDYLD